MNSASDCPSVIPVCASLYSCKRSSKNWTSAEVGCVSTVKGSISIADVPPRDCALSLLRVLCCHTLCAVSTAKLALAWERYRGDSPMDLATVDKLLTTTRTVRK